MTYIRKDRVATIGLINTFSAEERRLFIKNLGFGRAKFYLQIALMTF